ncbi:hypothetical protein J8273_4788 [Carpediemonas membranifera]|uniref:Uncharacterized protein n=1 Tax=Carpediemonas membranifera TaxID=201153 RepID=A0A8J6DZI8_9EUKA|nr:hypothetical protein J8273_4788 [Carpediemonas membranifera]|eukprot:KAG9393669.1 hypothetical protein J8273_4788 [Carpediemonas membranifera]
MIQPLHDYSTAESGHSLDDLSSMLSSIQLNPGEHAEGADDGAQSLVDHAHSIIVNGPPLSMNVELGEGEELPVALHTLLQGTLFAIFMQAGANPDLYDTTAIIDSSMSGQCLWFLCKKFFFSHQVALKDCDRYEFTNATRHHRYITYMGHIYQSRGPLHSRPLFAKLRLPRGIWWSHGGETTIVVTPKGLYGLGDNSYGQLGFDSCEDAPPTRITFPEVPAVTEYEVSLAPWHKDGLVQKIDQSTQQTVVVTPAGSVLSGFGVAWFTLSDRTSRFHTIRLPSGFVPDDITEIGDSVLSMGDRQVIGGANTYGQLGLGHRSRVDGYVDLPFDSVLLAGAFFRIFVSGCQLIFAGHVPPSIAQSGLLPGFGRADICATPRPLQFRSAGPITGFMCEMFYVVWVTMGHTFVWTMKRGSFTLPFEATKCDFEAAKFCQPDGRWVALMSVVNGVAELCSSRPEDFARVIWPVEVDPVRL